MRNLSETHGVELIRRIAKEKIQKKENRIRVWSEEMRSWGFFSEMPDDYDTFLIIGCSNPGDIFIPTLKLPCLFATQNCNIIENINENDFHVILELKEFFLSGMKMYGLEMLGSSPPRVNQLLAYQNDLFKIAWNTIT